MNDFISARRPTELPSVVDQRKLEVCFASGIGSNAQRKGKCRENKFASDHVASLSSKPDLRKVIVDVSRR